MKRTGFLFISVLAVLVSLGAVALAQQEEQFLDGKVRFGDGVVVPGNETVDGDLYLFGGDIEVDGDVTGDLIAFGGNVVVTGDIGGDLLVGTGTLEVVGAVDGDLRVGAGQVTTRGNIGEDAVVGAGQLRIDGAVGGDVVFGAGLVDIGGTVAGDVLGQTGSYTVSGTVVGVEDVTIDEPDREVERPNVFVRALYRFASLLLLGLLLLWLRRSAFERSIEAVDRRPGPTALWGLGFFFGLVIVPGMVTLVGVLLAILFGWLGLGLVVGVVVVLIVLSWILAAVAGFLVIAILAPLTIGAWLGTKFLPDETAGYLAMAAGVAAVVIVGMVPVLNVLAWLAITIMGGGAWLSLMQRGRSEVGTRPVGSLL